MTDPDISAIEARLAELETIRKTALGFTYIMALKAAVDDFAEIVRSQSRALAEREEEANRMRYYLRLVLDVGQDEETSDITPETAISLAQTWAGLALASVPKGDDPKPRNQMPRRNGSGPLKGEGEGTT